MTKSKNGIGLKSSKNLTEQSRTEWFCDHRACISLGGRISTDTGGTGCRRVERTVSCQEHTQQQSTRYTQKKVRVAIDALEYEYNHDTRKQPPRLSAARLHLAVGRRGLGPREQEEQCYKAHPERVVRGYVSYREYTQSSSELIVLRLDAG